MNLEYYVRRSVGGHAFDVSKFDNFGPLRLYEVHYPNGSCECMAWRSNKTRPCKHFAMVKEFIAAGEPQPFLLRR